MGSIMALESVQFLKGILALSSSALVQCKKRQVFRAVVRRVWSPLGCALHTEPTFGPKKVIYKDMGIEQLESGTLRKPQLMAIEAQ